METGKTGTDKQIILFALVVVLVSLFQYVNSYRNEFVWDSAVVFHMDPSIRELKYLPECFRESYQAHYPAELKPGTMLRYYRPLIKAVHIVEYQAFGDNPVGYNTVNIVLNAAVVVLAFFLVNAVTGDTKGAFLAAFLYAVNPTRVEVVSWAYSDSYIFMAFLSFLSLLLYHQKRYAFSYATFALSLFCHESAILLPVIVILYELLIPGEGAPRWWIRTLPFIVIASLFLILRSMIVGAFPLTDLDPVTFSNTVMVIIKRYVKIDFLPDAPITIYPHELFSRLTAEVAVSYAVVIGLIIFGVFLYRKNREYLFWYLWFFVWIAVSLNVGQFGDYLMAEKLLYIASFGFCVLIARNVVNVQRRKAVVLALVCCVAVFHFATTLDRTRYWKDNITYLEKALEFKPDFLLVTVELGNAYLEQGALDKAILINERSEAIAPRYGLPYLLQGVAYGRKGDIVKATKEFKMAIQLDPSDPRPYYNMGCTMERTGDFKQALHYYRMHLAHTHDPFPMVLDRVRELEKKVEQIR